MSIQSCIYKIRDELNAAIAALSTLDEQITLIDKEILSIRNSGSPETEKQLVNLNKQKRSIQSYYSIATKIISYQAPQDVQSEIPNETQLLLLHNRLQSPQHTNKVDIARNMASLAVSYIKYIDNEIEHVLKISEGGKLRLIEEKQAIKEANQLKKEQIIRQCAETIATSQIKDLYSVVHDEFETLSIGNSDWGNAVDNNESLLFGCKGIPLNIPQELLSAIKESAGHNFDEKTQTVGFPCGFVPGNTREITVEYTARNAQQLKSGVIALLMNFFRYYPLGKYRISLIDKVYYNSEMLGNLAASISSKNSIIDPVPANDESIDEYISILTEQYRAIEAKIGIQSVEQYNLSNESSPIPLRLLIINNSQSNSVRDNEDLSYLLNNATKLGIIPIILNKSNGDGVYGTEAAKKIVPKTEGQIRIISSEDGSFYIEGDPTERLRWQKFIWFIAPEITNDYVLWVKNAIQPKKVVTDYFQKNYPNNSFSIPTRSVGSRRPISLEFAVDEDGNVQRCDFEDDQFAAYMMGASGSGKSTLLHTLISGLLMNYHPDEIELWLVDYKMTEFIQYIDHCPPHVKYVLLENTEDLTFDILDQLSDLMNKRKYVFSKNKWQKLTDVPLNVYMPAVFVIIDEFSVMSQIIKETKGCVPDYTLKLQNLLAQGRALGIKFLFASQTYSEGVNGLTETARKQIQMRFALKNTSDEIKQTLVLAPDDISAKLRRDILSLPKYESLFKFRNADGELEVGRLKNMYAERDKVDSMVEYLVDNIQSIDHFDISRDDVYVNKHPILIDGGTPKTYYSQLKLYHYTTDDDCFDDNDKLIFPGVPCSFQITNHFLLCDQFDENILIVGGTEAAHASVLMSVLKSYDSENERELWCHKRTRLYRKYQERFDEEGIAVCTSIEGICKRISILRERINEGTAEPQLLIIMGYDSIVGEMQRLAFNNKTAMAAINAAITEEIKQRGLTDTVLQERLSKARSKEEYFREINEYNERIAAYNRENSLKPHLNALTGISESSIEDLKWLFQNASEHGVHIVLCCNTAHEFKKSKLDSKMFRHKLLFAIPKDDAYDITGNRLAAEIPENVCLYCGETRRYTMRPHLHINIPVNGWTVKNFKPIPEDEVDSAEVM